MPGSIRACRLRGMRDGRQPEPTGLDAPGASSPGAGVAGLPGRPARALAGRTPDRQLARCRSDRDRPLPPSRAAVEQALEEVAAEIVDRKSTRLNSSHT